MQGHDGGIPAYLRQLNDEQRHAATTLDGPVLVLAGAGTGKTELAVRRLQHLIRSKHTRASRLVMMTFAKPAAESMRARVLAEVGPRGAGVKLGTFHNVFGGLLRDEPEIAGLDQDFSIIDRSAGIQIVRGLLIEAGIKPEEHAEPGARKPPTVRELATAVLAAISVFKGQGLVPSRAAEKFREQGDAVQSAVRLALDFYRPYREVLLARNAADYDDLLLYPILAMQQDESLRREWAARWDGIQVDEYQDTSPLQDCGLELLARDHRNLMVVGDHAQAIYAFRGATASNIVEFANRWQGTTVIRLVTNYRCNPMILAAANALIRQNRSPVHNELEAGRQQTGYDKPLLVYEAPNPTEAARFTITKAVTTMATMRKLSGGDAGKRALVLYRANYQSADLIDAAVEQAQQFRVVGDISFYKREEVADVLNFIALMEDPEDLEAFLRVANKPARGLGERSLAKIQSARSRGGGKSLLDGSGADLTRVAASGLEQLRTARSQWLSDRERNRPLDESLGRLLSTLDYARHWDGGDDGQREDRLENINELLARAAQVREPDELLELARSAAAAEREDADLVMMSIHRAKGLEEDIVLSPGWSEGTFPSQRSSDDCGLPPDHPDHPMLVERNLAYVGLTRARHVMIVIWHSEAHGHSRRPSVFLEEIPERLKEEYHILDDPAFAPSACEERGLPEE